MAMGVVHAQGELIAQVRPGVTSAVALFTAQTLRVEVTLLVATVVRSAVGNIDIDLFHDDDGLTFDDTTIITSIQKAVNADSFVFQAQHPGSGILIKPGGSLGVSISTANAVNFSLYGISEIRSERLLRSTT